jgi:hypothetical protein
MIMQQNNECTNKEYSWDDVVGPHLDFENHLKKNLETFVITNPPPLATITQLEFMLPENIPHCKNALSNRSIKRAQQRKDVKSKKNKSQNSLRR